MNLILESAAWTRLLAAVVATFATLILVGTPLSLAEHYARNSESGQATASALACQAVPGKHSKT